MKGLSHRDLQRQNELKKIVRSLSKVSEVDTKDIRKDIHRLSSNKKVKREQFVITNDKLLKDRVSSTPSFEINTVRKDKGIKIRGFREKKMESQAVLQQANYQYKKLNHRKEHIAKKYRQYLARLRPKQPAPKPIYYPIDMNNLSQIAPEQVFEDGDLAKQYQNEDVDEEFISKIKRTVNSSRVAIKDLYQEHLKSIKLLSLTAKHKERERMRTELSQIKISQFTLETPSSPIKWIDSQQMSREKSLYAAQTQAQFIPPKLKRKNKRRSLVDLIRLSASRLHNREEQPDEKMTMKERVEYSDHDKTVRSLRKVIDKDHKLKESIVFTGLKKLLYGDRKGRFIQDNAFKTRLKGQNTQNYMKVLQEQNKIFQNYEGGYFNRRNLAQKLSQVLGMLHKGQKTPQKVTRQQDI